MNLPFVSVIVPVWNSPELLAKCLDALAVQTYPADRFEVLVVDNGSTDATPQVARGYGAVTLLHEPNPGSYNARNCGLARARGEWIAFTDADCVPAPDWLEAGVRAAGSNPDAGVLAGRIELFRSDPRASDACAKFEQMFGFRQSINVAKGFCVTANWMSPRRVLQDLGGFNGALKSGGDGEMAGRIAAAGHALVYAPEMLISHPVRGDLRELLAKRRRVVGGAWARLESRARPLTLFRSTLANGARKGWEVVRARELAVLDRLKLSGIVLLALGVELAEALRLAGGGKPTRA